MKNLQLRSVKQIGQLIVRNLLILVTIGFFGSTAYSQITTTIPASRCGAGPVILHATATTGTIKWYDVPFYGTPIATGVSTDGSTFTTPSLSVTKTYYVDAVDNANCSLNPGNARTSVIATVSANSIQANIFYSSTAFCKSVVTPQQVTRTGNAGGVFTASPAGLVLDATTGAITPGSSVVGTYTVTYTVIPAVGCVENPATTSVVISAIPAASSISYSGSPFCTTAGTMSVIRTGSSGGTYSASPSGLSIDPATGAINTASSSTGTYTITYFVAGVGGCAPQSPTTTITVLQLPTAAISYSSPFTKNQTNQPVTLTGTGVYTGGVFSSSAGLSINSSTGTIEPTTSTAGNYSVTYTLASVSPCAQVTSTTNILIEPMPSASIGGTVSVCQNATAPDISFTGSNGLAPYTFTYIIGTGSNQTVTTSSGNSVTISQPTNVSGTYLYTLLGVSDANGSSQTQTGTATVTVNTLPVATFNYAETPYCSNVTNPSPAMLDGGLKGTFSSSAGLVFVSVSTGEVNLSATTPGAYTITNTISAAGGCGVVAATSSFTKTLLPVSTFHYGAFSYCQSGVNPEVIFDGSGVAGIFTSVPAGVQFVSGYPGKIDLAATTQGTYQILNTIAAANGCVEVISTFDGLSIVAPPAPSSVVYSGSPYCNSITAVQPVEFTGTTGGTYTASPSGLSINAATGAITPNTSTPGTYTVTYSVGGGSGCSAVTDEATVVINETPSITNLAAYSICSGTSPEITLTASMPSTFSWTLGPVSDIILDASVSTGSPTAISQILSNISYTNAGTVPYIVTPVSSVNACIGAQFTITVTVNPKPLLVINNPAAVCSPSTVDLTEAAVTSGSTSLLTYTYWTDEGATSSLSTPSAISASGTYYIKGTTGQGCFMIRDVSVTVDAAVTVASAGTDQAQCNSGSFTLAGNAPTVGTGIWAVVSGTATITDASLYNTLVTGVPSNSTVVLSWTIVNGTCNSTDNISLRNDADPTVANAGSDQAQCNSGSFTLAGNEASVGTGIWSVVSGTATIASLNSETSGITGVPAGSTAVLRWTIVNGTCSTQDNVSLTNNSLPTAPAAATHTPSQTQIVWNWSSVSGATGYKWNTTNNYGSATDLGSSLTRTETGLICYTDYTRYIWSYSASGCISTVTTLSQRTSSCADAIRSSLSTSLASYDASAGNSLVKITSVEYENIVTNLSATRVGYSGSLNSSWATSYTNNSTFSYNSNGNSNTTNTFSASNWAVAVSFIPALNPQGSFTCQLKYNSSSNLTDVTSLYSGATVAVQDRQFFAIKSPSVQLPGSATYVSFYSSSGIGTIGINGWFDYKSGNLTGAVSGWTTITDSPNAVPTIQVLQTSTKQW
jgi:hypothetical protein